MGVQKCIGVWLARWLRAHGIEAHVIHPSSVAVSREHRRAKTDRLDTGLLKRSRLAAGERDHCKMVAIATLADEDAKRPNRERQSLVGEQSRIVNRMKETLTRLGMRGFNSKLKKAADRLEGLRTAKREPIPRNTLAELHRDMDRRLLVRGQIRQIEHARLLLTLSPAMLLDSRRGLNSAFRRSRAEKPRRAMMRIHLRRVQLSKAVG